MANGSVMTWEQVTGPKGHEALRGFLDGVAQASEMLLSVIDAANAGEYDQHYAGNPDAGVLVTTSCHLMVLTVLNRLKGVNAAGFYKDDPLRYVRLNCLIQRMLGVERLTLGWPVYGFGAEVLGQTMIYTEAQAPGSDPGVPLLDLDNWRDMPAYDPDHPIAHIVRENLTHMARLSGIEPVAHLPAPYSLAAEIFGQEHLIGALTERPEFVSEFLDLIATRVLKPWCDDLVATVPDVWLELSDASGSPMFIGPENFLKYSVAPVAAMIADNPWGGRIFVANYRGDLPAGAKTRGRRKRSTATTSDMSFEKLLAAKTLCCPYFLTRLEADAAPAEKYTEAAIELNLPLYLGMGAVRLDRNSNPDVALAKDDVFASAKHRARQIMQVSNALVGEGKPRATLSWPGDLYIEDTNAETHLDLFQAVLDGVRAGAR